MQQQTSEKYLMTRKLSALKISDQLVHLNMSFGFVYNKESHEEIGVYFYAVKPGGRSRVEMMRTVPISNVEIDRAMDELGLSGYRKIAFGKVCMEFDREEGLVEVSFPCLVNRMRFSLHDNPGFRHDLFESLETLKFSAQNVSPPNLKS